MSTYELTIIAKEEKTAEEVSKLITDAGGAITQTNALGSRRLVYPINKENNGIYTSFDFTIDPQKVLALNKRLFTVPSILRHLVTAKKPIKVQVSAPISKLSEELAKAPAAESEKTPEISAEPITDQEIDAPQVAEVPTAEEIVSDTITEKTEPTVQPVAEPPEPEIIVTPKPTKEPPKTPAEQPVEKPVVPTPEIAVPATKPVPVEKAAPKKPAAETKTKTKNDESEDEVSEEERLRALNEKLEELLKD